MRHLPLVRVLSAKRCSASRRDSARHYSAGCKFPCAILRAMPDHFVPDPDPGACPLDAYNAVAADPLRDGMEPLRWRDHAPVVTLLSDRSGCQPSGVVVEVPGIGPVRHLADVDSVCVSSVPA